MSISRRQVLTAACAAGATTLIGGRRSAAIPQTPPAEAFSFVHLTDMHVTPRRKGDQGYRRCIESVAGLKPRPRFVLMGGDLAFDGNYNEKADFDEQIRLYREISGGLGIPYYNCMGNHDALGYSARRKVPVDDPDIGKKMIMDRLEWEKSYYSFDHHGWHFVVLDSIYPIRADHGPAYEPRIGPEQLEWLAHDLGAAAGRPAVAVTHIAAFCHAGQIAGNREHRAMDGTRVIWDTRELRAVLERHGVKALLQGHTHRVEEYRFNDVWYLTSAAVSGAWWSGSWTGAGPGYTVFRCDGDQLSWTHHTFDWEPHLEPEDELERRRTAEQQAEQAEQQRLLELERAGRFGG